MMVVTVMMNGCQKELTNASSKNSGAEDADGAEDTPPERAQGQTIRKNVQKTKNNQFV